MKLLKNNKMTYKKLERSLHSRQYLHILASIFSISVLLTVALILTFFPENLQQLVKQFSTNWRRSLGNSEARSNFYERVSRAETDPKKCSKLLRQLGSETDSEKLSFYGNTNYCKRLEFLLDNCVSSDQSHRNLFNQSDLFSAALSQSKQPQSANLLFITFDGLDITQANFKETFTSKLLSYFTSAVQKQNLFNKTISHTPAYSCQALISAINLETDQSKLVVYGPKSFGIHRVLSTKRPNFYVFWLKHPFIIVYQNYLDMYRALSLGINEFGDGRSNKSSEKVDAIGSDSEQGGFSPPAGVGSNNSPVGDALKMSIITSRGSFNDFLLLIKRDQVCTFNNPNVRSMINWNFSREKPTSNSQVGTKLRPPVSGVLGNSTPSEKISYTWNYGSAPIENKTGSGGIMFRANFSSNFSRSLNAYFHNKSGQNNTEGELGKSTCCEYDYQTNGGHSHYGNEKRANLNSFTNSEKNYDKICPPGKKIGIDRTHYKTAVENFEKYVAFLGSSENDELHLKSTHLLCAILNLNPNCFGASRHLRSTFAGASSATFPDKNSGSKINLDSKMETDSKSEPNSHVEEFLTTLSAESIEFLTEMNRWDLEFFDYAQTKLRDQFHSPLANGGLSPILGHKFIMASNQELQLQQTSRPN
ncbi:uncharacterized protein LOC142335065 [Convolutriloba macropyga]|uniref:uncharacterized protein LOC142335065 n=1 Tax=Convolutriloba macropyga TaxID=536237 RepID=UPI003F5226D8